MLGFTKDNQIESISQALEKNRGENKLLAYLDRNPSINGYCYSPLNMAILLVYVMLERIPNYQQPKQKSIKNLFA